MARWFEQSVTLPEPPTLKDLPPGRDIAMASLRPNNPRFWPFSYGWWGVRWYKMGEVLWESGPPVATFPPDEGES